jgi:exopolysaccharide biosynthesis polyprenyl glycosylphosphotransferase
MASSEFWHRLSASLNSSREWETAGAIEMPRSHRGAAKLWIAADAITIVISVALATIYDSHSDPLESARGYWQGTLIHGESRSLLLALLLGFTLALIASSRRMHLYEPMRLIGFLHEQRLSAQACLVSGLLLIAALYLVHDDNIPRSIVLIAVGLVAVALGLRRLVYRILLYRRYARGVGTRNVLIVGTCPQAHALRHHLESVPELGYTFKGFIDLNDIDLKAINLNAQEWSGPEGSTATAEVVGTLETVFQQARKHHVEEVFVISHHDRSIVQGLFEQARVQGVSLRVVPDLYDGLARSSPIEYIGQFPTVPLHCGQVPELGLILKRGLDILFSGMVLLAFLPLLAVIAFAVKLDSPGPVFYSSERIGKKGRVFRCTKFRTMVRDAEQRRAEILHMNERDDVLFKISNDPRITGVGHILRKYSLDELPQFWNVLQGDMSVVGPRPPLASEVEKYKPNHLRRLDVTPGITGLWQVEGRQDPSFASYVSLDVTYINQWSVWLDLKIILRTIGVVFAGTGS